jgi:hypothetical protein
VQDRLSLIFLVVVEFWCVTLFFVVCFLVFGYSVFVLWCCTFVSSAFDFGSDIWCLGVVIVHDCIGRKVFDRPIEYSRISATLFLFFVFCFLSSVVLFL